MRRLLLCLQTLLKKQASSSENTNSSYDEPGDFSTRSLVRGGAQFLERGRHPKQPLARRHPLRLSLECIGRSWAIARRGTGKWG